MIAVEVSTTAALKKYHEVVRLPEEVDVETAKSKYNNVILEVIFNKKSKQNLKDKENR